ncbi:MAG TPA: arylsulfatase [Anaerohalosphaeraceae bacterium]|nr:arylsulfatase [Phycisphaerae bacterium]HOK95007.1 arylsulfatase [Anaerohalosphaeraceae bacterium]HOL30413.1 arylsulfatase [Anaerohalosphaeraceae bacterium]HOM75685.1 arylsulfatase [Anaerohalosphaeraceae bacterium]HPC64187.1 arylsulfatase [Anaerohalosphaeraceae bacterium]
MKTHPQKLYSRRHFLKTAAASAAAVYAGCCSTQQICRRQSAGKPNIIYILADDLGYGDLSCYGQKRFSTPHIDRLADEGLLFTRHYAGSTVCAPSRCSLMTGLHTGHCQIRGNLSVEPEGQWPLAAGTKTAASVLKEAGYSTGAFGKWGLGGPDSSGDPNRQGFDEFFGFKCQTMAHKYYQRYLWRNNEKVYLPGNDPEKQTGQYCHDLIVDQAIEFIKTHHKRPFFAYLALTIPHAELAVPADSLEKYKGLFPEDNPFIPNPNQDYGRQLHPRAAYAAMIDRMDRDVGRILTLLKELHIDDNTIVFFSSDNGPHKEGGGDPDFFDSNGPLRGYKRDLYEGGIRVPLLVRWPSVIKAGTRTDHISAFWDTLPTFAQLAGTQSFPDSDGISFLPVLLGNPDAQLRHPYLYWEFHERGGKQAVLIGNQKAVRLNAMNNPDAPLELYDLAEDPSEENNIAAAHPQLIEKMTFLIHQAHKPNKTFPFFASERNSSLQR